MGFEGKRVAKPEKRKSPSPMSFEGTIEIKTAPTEQLVQYGRYLESMIAGSYLDPDTKKEFSELQEEVERELEKRAREKTS